MLAAPLAEAFNQSILSGTFPDGLKKALVVPVLKSVSEVEIENYIPISLLSSIGKIFEYLAKDRIMRFLNKHEFFSSRQYSFLPGRFTDLALVDHNTEIVDTVEHRLNTVAVYIDINKAFDTVDHGILLHKLEKIGIRGFMLQWFRPH